MSHILFGVDELQTDLFDDIDDAIDHAEQERGALAYCARGWVWLTADDGVLLPAKRLG